ncbi:phosphatidylinositol kinase [Caballeronia novacaledonica]|uniref:Phosphatidylinositol kinase n=1 Tax=Caballeronia novacaledonica TaxID=1544861 RepID=A0A2U3IC59_9BURK|nr:HipA domain-containing protein [Caballeronia novacaledonica]SPB17798.1 phosphatidylinositol kinase [Caballeronia novacaledonica]
MTAKDSYLHVFANVEAKWTHCGELALLEDGSELLSSSFRYDARYTDSPGAFALDPVSLSFERAKASSGKPVRPTYRHSQFGAIRDASPDAWGRRVIEVKLRAPANSLPESVYLLHAGSERVGALDVRSDAADRLEEGAGRLEDLGELMEAAACIEAGVPVRKRNAPIFACGSGLGGAPPKLSVRDEDSVVWVANLPSQGDRFDVAAVEAATLNMATDAGLRVPNVRTISLDEHRVMHIERFDRRWSEAREPKVNAAAHARKSGGHARPELRVPFISALTLLGRDEFESRTQSYAGLASAIWEHCDRNVVRRDLAKLFERMVFNIFVTNLDDHLRNHGFIYDFALPGWRLSPLYDVLPSPSYAFERHLHLGVGEEGKLATLDNAVSRCDAFGISESEACMLIGLMWDVVKDWRSLFAEDGVAEKDMDYVSTAIRHIDDISTEELRRWIT